MTPSKASRLFDRIDQIEYRWCQKISSGSAIPSALSYFRCVSWLGNGWFWYALILLLPISHGLPGWQLAALMTVTGLICTLSYKGLKTRLVRERPFISFPGIQCAMAPLDRYSFPSGHSMHAACFNTLLLAEMPWLGWLVLPFSLSVMASRVVLGLHYPSDVLVGTALGALCALLGLSAYPVI